MKSTPDMATLKAGIDLSQVMEDLGYPARSGGMHDCPICGSGTHEHGTPGFSVWAPENRKWKCFSCQRSGDIFDLAGFMGAGDSKKDQLAQVVEWAEQFGWPMPLEWESGAQGSTPRRSSAPIQAPQPSPMPEPTQSPEKPLLKAQREREARYIQAMRKNLDHPEMLGYLSARGISRDDAWGFGLGFDPKHHRLIIPFPGSSYYHIDRTTADDQRKYLKPSSAHVGPQPIYNSEALTGGRIIVVEGPLDAIALSMVGYGDQVVALAGTAYRDLFENLRLRRYQGLVVVALDNDPTGQKAQEEFVAALQEQGIDVVGLDLWKELGVKDAGEALQHGREALKKAVSDAMETLEKERDGRAFQRLDLVSGEDVIQSLWDLGSYGKDPIPTGFPELDRYLGGGLMPGLYVLGAISSTGKTTFLLQMADQVAMSGNRVLFVTAEQGSVELGAKSISRLMRLMHGVDLASQELMKPSRWNELMGDSTTSSQLIRAQELYYSQIAPRLVYQEAPKITLQGIEEAARFIFRRYGEAPVIVIDYLQLIKLLGADGKPSSLSEKQTVDEIVSALRILSKDLQTPIIAISSLNRSSYGGVVEMDSFKESGAIEYGSDVLMGLQPQQVREAADTGGAQGSEKAVKKAAKNAKSKKVRDMEVVILKNRSGFITKDSGISFTYRAVSNLFEEQKSSRPF